MCSRGTKRCLVGAPVVEVVSRAATRPTHAETRFCIKSPRCFWILRATQKETCRAQSPLPLNPSKHGGGMGEHDDGEAWRSRRDPWRAQAGRRPLHVLEAGHGGGAGLFPNYLHRVEGSECEMRRRMRGR